MPAESMGVLHVEDADGVRLLTFNRPEARNAFNQELWYAIRDALIEAEQDDSIRCIVFTGAPGAFTAGMDLKELGNLEVFADGETPGYVALMPVIEAYPKVLLAAVNGVGVGIGMTMLLHCDMAYVSDDARLRAPFISLGVTTEASASVTFPAVMGWQRAAHTLFMEPWIDAQTAVDLGLALDRFPADRLLDEVMAVARQIGALPLEPLMATKRMLVAGRIDSIRAARERELEEFNHLVGEQLPRA